MVVLSPYLEYQDVGNIGMLCKEFSTPEWAARMTIPLQMSERIKHLYMNDPHLKQSSEVLQLVRIKTRNATQKCTSELQLFKCYDGRCMHQLISCRFLVNQDIVPRSTCMNCAFTSCKIIYVMNAFEEYCHIMENLMAEYLKPHNRPPSAFMSSCNMWHLTTRSYFDKELETWDQFPAYQFDSVLKAVRYSDLLALARRWFQGYRVAERIKGYLQYYK